MADPMTPYPHGYWSCAYALQGELQRPNLSTLRELLRKGEGGLTGWPVWWVPDMPEARPTARQGVLECFMGGTAPDSADFWRASPDGRFFLMRGYQEDSRPSQIEPGTLFDLTIPIWRTGECLLHASRMASLMGDPAADLTLRMRWTGLRGRKLTAWSNRQRDVRHRVASEDDVATTVEAGAGDVEQVLVELVESLMRPLYELFDLFVPHQGLFVEELARLTNRTG